MYKNCIGNASIKQFIENSKIRQKQDDPLMFSIMDTGNQILSLEEKYKLQNDTKELYTKIITRNIQLKKKYKFNNILLKNATRFTYFNFLKKHLTDRIKSLSQYPKMMIHKISNDFICYLNELTNFLEKMRHLIPTINFVKTNGYRIKSRYVLIYDNYAKCFYEYDNNNNLKIIGPEMLNDIAKLQEQFFNKYCGKNKLQYLL